MDAFGAVFIIWMVVLSWQLSMIEVVLKDIRKYTQTRKEDK